MYSSLALILQNSYRHGTRKTITKFGNQLYGANVTGMRSFSDNGKDLPESFENIQSQKVQFSPSRARDLTGEALEIQNDGEVHDTGPRNTSDDHVVSYDGHGNVNLSSVMQTTVPEPYTTPDKAPTHLNMPGGNWQQGEKYLAEDLKGTHYVQPVRKMCTFTGKVLPGTCARPLIWTVNSCHSSTSSGVGSSNDVTKPTTQQRLKRAVKDYGATVIVFHVTISLASLGGFYLAVSSGLDVANALIWLGVSESVVQSKLAAGASTFVLAYAIHKVFAPARIAVTLTATPFIVRHLRKIGFLSQRKNI